VTSSLCEHTFVRRYTYSLVEDDADRPWIVVGDIQHLTVELDDDANFFDWAARKWPKPRFEAPLMPGNYLGQ
jgi:hypothetical protein